MKKTLKKIAAFTLAATMLAGCSGSTTSTTATTAAQKAEATATEAAGATVETTAAPMADVDYKEHVVIGTHQSIDGVDPHGTGATKVVPQSYFMSVYNTLISLDENTLEFSPELATEWEWKDDVTLELKLRDDVNFHDGSHMTSADVVFTFERLIAEKKAAVTYLDKVEAIDDYTVRMTVKSPNMDWETQLATINQGILSKAACESDPEEGFTIGTGPWKLESWVAGDYVDIVRNDAYWGDVPKTEKMTYRYIAENASRVIALQNGELDMCYDVAQEDVQYVVDDSNLSLTQIPSTSLYYLAFDTSEAPGNDQNLRLAIAHAINVDDIMAVATNGVGEVAVTDWGKNTIGYYDGFGAYEYNLDLAKEYLDKAFPNGGAKIRFTCAGSIYKAILSVIQEQVRPIGLEIEIEQVESAAQTAMSKFDVHEHEALCYGYVWDSGSVKAMQRYSLANNNNKAILSNERVIELLDLGLQEKDVEKRKDYYKEVQEMNHEQAWYIPLYYIVKAVGTDKDASGYILNPSCAHDLAYMVVEE